MPETLYPQLNFIEVVMKKMLFLVAFLSLESSLVLAEKNCFLATENNRVVQKIGQCQERQSPCSTFKVVISLMGYDSGILQNEFLPAYPYKGGSTVVEACKQSQTPASWLKNSCLWYSQEITQKLGMEKFKQYLMKFNYGNQDASGDMGKGNGLTDAWLDSSLKISPEEQIQFLEKLTVGKLPISAKAQKLTKQIMFVDNLKDGWKLYGKTGSKNKKAGWFVGWIEKGDRKIIFAQYVDGAEKRDSWGGKKAKDEALHQLTKLIESKTIES